MKARILSYGFSYSFVFICSSVFIWLCLLSAGPAVAKVGSSATSSVSLQLDDGTTQPMQSLEIGRSLSAKVTGLAAGQQISVVLRDAMGWPVVSVGAAANPMGEVEVAPLWRATGIIGCQCDSYAATYVFRRVESALVALAGEIFEVEVTDTSGIVLTTATVPLVTPTRPIAFPADASGCPRFDLHDIESLYMVVLGGTAGMQTSVTVAPGLSGPIAEVRLIKPEGPSFALSGQALEVVLLWPGPATIQGPYRLVVSGGGWPTLLGPNPGPKINSGFVVTDHACPPFPG